MDAVSQRCLISLLTATIGWAYMRAMGVKWHDVHRHAARSGPVWDFACTIVYVVVFGGVATSTFVMANRAWKFVTAK